MNIEKIVLEIAQSHNEKKFNAYIQFVAKKTFQDQKNICNSIFTRFDIEIEKDSPNQDFLRTLVSIPVELAIFHQSQRNLNSHNEHCEIFKQEELIDFISSHFLARSNGTHESLRLAIMIFFSGIKNQPQWKKQRILERFGENILMAVFKIYDQDKAKSSLAFNFLAENLESFLSTSPDLAAMTNSFLQTYMFKQKLNFIVFMNQYKNYLSSKKESAKFFVIHLSFLIRQAFELEHEELSFNLTKIFIEYVYSFVENKSAHDFEIFYKIMLQSKSLIAREVGLYIQKELQNKHKITCKEFFKNISVKNEELSFSSATSLTKKKTNQEDVSPFQKILLLWSET